MKVDFNRVMALVKPVFEALMKTDGPGLYILVAQGDKKLPLDEAIVFTHSVGDFGNCDKIARAKAAVSWRTGYSSRDAALRADMLLESGDCVWPGSIAGNIGDNRQVVAVSGLTGNHDEYLATMIMLTIDMVADEMVEAISKAAGIL